MYSVEIDAYHYPAANLKVCSIGWRIPDLYDFYLLYSNYGGEEDAGGQLKEIGTDHWQSPNIGATNESGFTALPGGYRDSNGSFNNLGYEGIWLTSERATPSSSLRIFRLDYDTIWADILGGGGFKHAYSVSCLKDN